MTEIRRADPAARRQAVALVIGGALAGTLLIVGFERCQVPIRDWILSEPAELVRRARLVLGLVAGVLSAPLIVFAGYLWWLGARVLRAREFPPPGYRVVRDTVVVDGPAAVRRGRGLKVLAACLGVASVFLWLLLWYVAGMLGGGAA